MSHTLSFYGQEHYGIYETTALCSCSWSKVVDDRTQGKLEHLQHQLDTIIELLKPRDK